MPIADITKIYVDVIGLQIINCRPALHGFGNCGYGIAIHTRNPEIDCPAMHMQAFTCHIAITPR